MRADIEQDWNLSSTHEQIISIMHETMENISRRTHLILQKTVLLENGRIREILRDIAESSSAMIFSPLTI